MKTYTLALSGLLLTAAIASPTRADLRYTTEMKMGAPAAAGEDAQASAAAAKAMPAIRTTTFYKNMDERIETSMNMMGLFQSNDVTLTLCGTQESINMDPALKIYTVGPISGAPELPPSDKPQKPVKAEKTGAGKMTTTFTVQDLGMEKLQNLDTRHAMVTTRVQTSGCLGTADTTFRFEVWVAPKKIAVCPERFAPSRVVAGVDGGCSITYEVKGDAAGMQKAMSGMIVQQKFYMDDKVSMVQELRDYSEAALDASLFAVPADYKKVSKAEYDKAKAAAMQKAMMRGITSGAQNAATASKADADPNASAKNPSSGGGKTVGDEVADTVGDAANDAVNDAKNQTKDEIRKKIKLPRIRF